MRRERFASALRSAKTIPWLVRKIVPRGVRTGKRTSGSPGPVDFERQGWIKTQSFASKQSEKRAFSMTLGSHDGSGLRSFDSQDVHTNTVTRRFALQSLTGGQAHGNLRGVNSYLGFARRGCLHGKHYNL
jgi:hypothetical protein